MASTVPISNTNIVTLIGLQADFETVATTAFQIAYEQNTLVRNQSLEKNTELRGNRQPGTKVPGQQSPGGTILGHQTDQLLPMSWYAALGSIVSTQVTGAAPTAVPSLVAGLVDVGNHFYKIVVTRPNGTMASAASAVAVADGTHGKITVTNTIPMASGWTWAIYRTVADDLVSDPYLLIPATATLAYNVTSYLDNTADAALLGAYPAITNNDWSHVIKTGDTLPALSIERKLPYVSDAAEYYVALGCVVNKATVKITGTGYYDIGLDYLFGTLDGPNAASMDAAPTDWRSGEKIHHAMALAAKVKVDGSAFAKFQDLTITHSNNLDTSDYPVGGGGTRGSLVPLQAETAVSGTLKVTDPESISFVQDTTVTHTLEIQHDFATPGHYIKHQLYGIQFDPTDPAPSGQGILKFTANGSASQPTGGEQIIVTIVNDQPDTTYQP